VSLIAVASIVAAGALAYLLEGRTTSMDLVQRQQLPKPAGPVVLLGITMNQPLMLPHCKRSELQTYGDEMLSEGIYSGAITCSVEQILPKKLARELDKNVDPAFRTKRDYTIKFSPGGAPSYLEEVVVSTLHDAVERIDIKTNGEGGQQQAFDDLKEKFGPPTESNVETLQNGFGARFQGIAANWDMPSQRVSVEFKGVFLRRDEGNELESRCVLRSECLKALKKGVARTFCK
jgi:hypothetical protein